ncbi:NitT/TauT family transport system permease protein [Loktanella sp. PT4BL]|jgi:NitT/TauT family transport system permease protein|uniref:ABC transporter permease n=1 Tax=Rhodobacterales TaxID=204455 RepID=UPI000B38532F|nr:MULTISPECIES: ABC transporter permease [Rhodobacterales]PXW66285.1 NitT/TauT family transport system permease protein [Loktanella sp. PT4BL]
MTNNKPKPDFFAVRGSVGHLQSTISAIGIWAVFFGVWVLATSSGWVNDLLVPSPQRVLAATYDLFINRGFTSDVLISIWRVFISFAIACAVAIPLGVAMGTFASIEAIFAPFVSAWRYLPAPSFIPILLMWFGTGEAPKLALLVIGVIFFLITLVMDHTKNVRKELIETALTLGANRYVVVLKVVFPAALPDIVTAMRQMLAMGWTYLVIAEIVASTTGIGAMMMRARRFLKTDEILAGIVVIGILGLLTDVMFRMLHRRLFPYLEVKN